MTDSSEMVKDADAQQDQCRYPIRVLHLTSLKKNNYFLNNLVDYCDRRAIEFTVVTLTGEGEFSAELRKRGILAYCLDCSQRRRAFHACCSLGQIIHRHDIDIVHTHLFEPTLIGMTVAKLLGKLTIMTRHHSDALYRIRNPFKRWVYLHLEQYSSALADHVIAPAAEVKRILVQCEKVRESKISLIPYPQDFRRFQSVSENDIAKVKRELDMGHTPDLVCVSRLHPEKGHIYLFEALAALRTESLNFTCYLVGEGPELKSLEESAERLGIRQSIRFLGWRDDALLILAAATVVVHPSLHEALPSALIEALALSKPIVASDVSGVRDIVNGYGEVVPPANSRAFADAVRLVLADIETANRRAVQGSSYILEYMAASRVAEAHVECYRSIVLSRHGR